MPDTIFHVDKKAVLLNGKSATVLDFWRWAFSMLEDNTLRGVVGQYIVAWAIGADNVIHDSWQAYDLRARNGKKIEVKTTAFVQVWQHGEKNRRPLFVIKPTRYYTHEKGMQKQRSYNADIYILCYYSWNDSSTMDVTNLGHWKFWVFSLKELLTVLNGKKSISVRKLQNLGYNPLNVFELKEAVLAK
ncbi:MAG: hypothetical protein ACREAE_04660 [Nitrosopumilaceae archaeon]